MKHLSTQSLRELVYGALLDAMVNGELKPGDRVRDQEIAQQLGVSRTPVREALRQLEDQGLIRTFRGSRTEVAPIDEKTATQAVVVTAGLFAFAARLGVPRLTDVEIVEMEAADRDYQRAKRGRDLLEAIEADYRFHMVLVRASGNAELERMISSLLPKIRLLDYRYVSRVDVQHSARQHRAIIAACRRGDALETARLVEANLLPEGNPLTADVLRVVADPEDPPRDLRART
jgi:DNA-binding GntR family transcriptional regulator